MLKIDNITIAYKDVPTVMDFSLHMAQGQIVSLVGESGSGKTTVIRAILGLLAGGGKVTKGDILFHGTSPFHLNKLKSGPVRRTKPLCSHSCANAFSSHRRLREGVPK